jgi:hypothetical protein
MSARAAPGSPRLRAHGSPGSREPRSAQLWELPTSAHTKGLRDDPVTNAHRVRSLFDRALLTGATGS